MKSIIQLLVLSIGTLLGFLSAQVRTTLPKMPTDTPSSNSGPTIQITKNSIIFTDGSIQTSAPTDCISNCGGTVTIIPSGYMILGTSSTAPAGFTLTGTLNTGNSWNEVMPMPTARRNLAAAVVSGIIYALGGLDNTSGTIFFNKVEAYDPVTNNWSTVAPMPTARYHFSATAINGKIYAIGGSSNSSTAINTVEIYDPTSNSWTTASPMPMARASLAADILNGKIYVIGGFSALNTVEVYDPTTNSWSEAMVMLTGRSLLAAASINGNIYAIGGYSTSQTLSTVEQYVLPSVFYTFTKN